MRKPVSELIKQRYSCRAYQDKPIDGDRHRLLSDFLASDRTGPLGGRARFALGDWREEITGTADVILVNPPYISSQDIVNLAPEVRAFEPPAALDGGPDGLAAYRDLAPAVQQLLTPRGFACFELGFGQGAAVRRLLGESGLKINTIRRDLSGIERCIVATL